MQPTQDRRLCDPMIIRNPMTLLLPFYIGPDRFRNSWPETVMRSAAVVRKYSVRLVNRLTSGLSREKDRTMIRADCQFFPNRPQPNPKQSIPTVQPRTFIVSLEDAPL